MHIADGYLPPDVIAGGFACAGALVATSLVRFPEEKIPEIGVLTGLFFVATLIGIPTPPTSVHLLLHALLGIVLGRASTIAIAVGMSFQAFLLGHGGLTTLGVNTTIAASGALVASAVFRSLAARDSTRRLWIASVLATLASFAVASALFILALYLGDPEHLGRVARWLLAPQAIVAPIECIFTGAAVAFVARVRPESLWRSAPR